jgi:hypothetical protein
VESRFKLDPIGRQLAPSFFFGRSVIAWRCSVCGKLFCVPSINDGTPGDYPPNYLRRDFEHHSCMLQLQAEFAHKQVRS